MDQIDKSLLKHAAALGAKDGGPDIADVYGMQEMAELHYYLKVEHGFAPDEMAALLQFADPLAVAMECWEERELGKGFPICDLLHKIKAHERFPLVNQAGYAQQKVKQLQSLKDLLDQNMSDFHAELLGMDKAEIIAKSVEITAMQEAYNYMKNDFFYMQDEIAILLDMENPLKFIAGHWPSDLGGVLDMDDLIREAIEVVSKDTVVQQETARFVSGAEKNTMTTDKPSVRGQLYKNLQEASLLPSSEGRSKGGVNR